MSGEPVEIAGSAAPPWLATAVVGALLAIGLAGIWSIDYLPTHDGPQHIYTTHAAQHLGDPAAGFDRYLEAGLPITAHGFAAVFAPFDAWLPWQSAYRIALTIMFLLWTLGSVALARSLDPRRIWLGVALAGAAFQWSLYMGLFSFYVATAFGLWVLAFALSRETFRAKDDLIVSGLLFVQGLFHVFPALLTALVLGALAVTRTSGLQRVREVTATLLSMTPMLLIAVALALGAAEQAEYHARSGAGWKYEWPGLYLVAKCFTGGPAWRAFALMFFACLSPLVAGAMFRERLRGRDMALLGLGASLLGSAFALPLHLQGWDLFSVRFLPLAITCLIIGFPVEKISMRGQRAIAVGATVLSLAGSLWALDYNRQLDQRSAPALSGLSAPVTRDGPRLPIVMDPYLGRPLENHEALMPFVVPLLNLGQLYATEQGGFAADTFAVSPSTHQVLIRGDAEPFPAYPDRGYAIALAAAAPSERPELRRKIASYAASFGAHFQDVILFGTEDDAALLIERGYEVDFQNKGPQNQSLLLAHFRGCSLALEVTDAEAAVSRDPDAPSTNVEMGWFPLLEASESFALSSTAQQHVELHTAPCGPVWLRVTSIEPAGNSVDKSSPSTPRTCRGADAQGRLILADPRATPIVRCDLGTS